VTGSTSISSLSMGCMGKGPFGLVSRDKGLGKIFVCLIIKIKFELGYIFVPKN